MFNISELSIRQLMELRVQVNASIAAIEADAFDALSRGSVAKGYAMKAGKKSRYIENTKQYRKVLQDAFEDTFESACMNHTIISLTAAEKLIKSSFDGNDAREIQELMADTLSTKTSASTLVYVGED